MSALGTPRSASGPRGPSLAGHSREPALPHTAGTRADAHLTAIRREFQSLWDSQRQPAAIPRATLRAALSRPRGPAPSEAALRFPLVPRPFESSPTLPIGRGLARPARPLVSVRRPHPVYLGSPDTELRFGSRPPVERPASAVCEKGEARATHGRSVRCCHPALGPCVTSGARARPRPKPPGSASGLDPTPAGPGRSPKPSPLPLLLPPLVVCFLPLWLRVQSSSLKPPTSQCCF